MSELPTALEPRLAIPLTTPATFAVGIAAALAWLRLKGPDRSWSSGPTLLVAGLAAGAAFAPGVAGAEHQLVMARVPVLAPKAQEAMDPASLATALLLAPLFWEWLRRDFLLGTLRSYGASFRPWASRAWPSRRP